jgi:indoleamine 2,3-dioxygenase
MTLIDAPMMPQQFDLDPQRGFLPAADPLKRLPAAFDAWEDAAQNLPKLLVSDRIRALLSDLPAFPLDALNGEQETRRAMLLLSYLGHAYVWGEPEAAHRLPACLAVPWHAIAKCLGRPPVLSYASYALDNWYRLKLDEPIALGNIALIQNFLGGIDEEWFILIHVDIEAKAASALNAIPAAQSAVTQNNSAALEAALQQMERALSAMYSTMERMPEHCDPYIYFHRVRPYIHGWKNNPALPEGLIYEDVAKYEGKGQLFRGETGAQSSIIPVLDALLGVSHRDDPLKEYLMEMRDYMPPKHRAFIEAVEGGASVRDYLLRDGRAKHGSVHEIYDACVTWVERFRSLHLEYAARYIFHQAQTSEANPAKVGTGGTPFMTYLKKHRDETREHHLHRTGH